MGDLGGGDGGYIDFESGLGTDEDGHADITIKKDVLAFGGSASGGGQTITFAGCGVNVLTGVKIDGHAGVNPLNNLPGGSDIELISRRVMSIGGSSLTTPVFSFEPRSAVGENCPFVKP